jgi:hypothetical protein
MGTYSARSLANTPISVASRQRRKACQRLVSVTLPGCTPQCRRFGPQTAGKGLLQWAHSLQAPMFGKNSDDDDSARLLFEQAYGFPGSISAPAHRPSLSTRSVRQSSVNQMLQPHCATHLLEKLSTPKICMTIFFSCFYDRVRWKSSAQHTVDLLPWVHSHLARLQERGDSFHRALFLSSVRMFFNGSSIKLVFNVAAWSHVRFCATQSSCRTDARHRVGFTLKIE